MIGSFNVHNILFSDYEIYLFEIFYFVLDISYIFLATFCRFFVLFAGFTSLCQVAIKLGLP